MPTILLNSNAGKANNMDPSHNVYKSFSVEQLLTLVGGWILTLTLPVGLGFHIYWNAYQRHVLTTPVTFGLQSLCFCASHRRGAQRVGFPGRNMIWTGVCRKKTWWYPQIGCRYGFCMILSYSPNDIKHRRFRSSTIVCPTPTTRFHIGPCALWASSANLCHEISMAGPISRENIETEWRAVLRPSFSLKEINTMASPYPQF